VWVCGTPPPPPSGRLGEEGVRETPWMGGLSVWGWVRALEGAGWVLEGAGGCWRVLEGAGG